MKWKRSEHCGFPYFSQARDDISHFIYSNLGEKKKYGKFLGFLAMRCCSATRVCHQSLHVRTQASARGLWLHCRFDAIALSAISMMNRSIITSLSLYIFAFDTVYVALMFNSTEFHIPQSNQMPNGNFHLRFGLESRVRFVAHSTESTRCHCTANSIVINAENNANNGERQNMILESDIRFFPPANKIDALYDVLPFL